MGLTYHVHYEPWHMTRKIDTGPKVTPPGHDPDIWREYMESIREVTYHGLRTGEGPGELYVWVEVPRPPIGGHLLPPYIRELPHTFCEDYEWGYSGAGPNILASALLTDALPSSGTRSNTVNYYRPIFVAKIVSRLPRHEWTLTRAFINQWIELHEKENTP